jgi:hypothetical protein
LARPYAEAVNLLSDLDRGHSVCGSLGT